MSFSAVIYGLSSPELVEEIRYIGKTVNFRVRWNRHRFERKASRRRLYTWWRSLPVEDPVITVIEEKAFLDKADANSWLNDREQKWIRVYRDCLGHRLTNHTNGGDGSHGWNHSPETIAKMRQDRSGSNHPNYGKRLSEATRAKISLSHLAYHQRKRSV